MQRVDGNWLYAVGPKIHAIEDLEWSSSGRGPVSTVAKAEIVLYVAEGAVDALIARSVFDLRTSRQPGQNLLQAIRAAREQFDNLQYKDAPIEFSQIYPVQEALRAFESVLAAEFSLCPLYLVMPKAGYDMPTMVESGHRCFGSELPTKVPDAVPDLDQGAKCLAFELFTAAGFHLHRANESVLRRYWDVVSSGEPLPGRNIGEILNGLKNQSFGDPMAVSSLTDLKNLHRNPLIHPEHTIGNADEAVALMHAINSAISYMLRDIPTVAPTTPVGAIGRQKAPF